jgi:hypothetical protein
MVKKKKPSEERADKRYWRTQDNLLAQAVDEVRRAQRQQAWRKQKGKR